MKKDNLFSITLTFLLCLVFFPANPSEFSPIIVIKGEKIYTVSKGIIDKGYILIENGKIKEIGDHISISPDSKIIEAKCVIPGLIDTHTHLGSKSDWNEYANIEFQSDVNPSLKIIDVIDLESVDFNYALSGGTTTVMVTPGSGNIIGGEIVVLKTAGRSGQNRILRNPAGLKMAFDSVQALEVASKELEEAQIYLKKKENVQKSQSKDEIFKTDLRKESLIKVLKKEIPARIHCVKYYGIKNALSLKEKFNIEVVIEHGLEGDKVINDLVKSKISVSFGPMLLKQADSLPDPIPGLFEKKGIKFSIQSDHPIAEANDLLIYAAQAVKYGLSKEMALKAITLNAAEILGVENRVGSIEPGKDADIVILDGDPFNIMTHVKIVLIDGEIVYREIEK